MYSDYVYGQNIPYTLHEQLKNYEHQQNFELLRHISTRGTQEGNILNQTAAKPTQNQPIQQENIQNSHFIPTTIQPEIKSKPDLKTVQIRPSIQTNLDTFQQIVPNFHHFSSVHPNSLSGINTIQVPFPYNTLRVPYPEPVPVHVKVPVSVVKPYPLTRTVTVPVENPVYIRVHQPIQVPVPQLYQVAVPQPIEMKVPQPVYIQVLPNGQQYILNNP